MPPETQGVVVIDGHRCESSWIANKVTCGRYGADFNVIQDAVDYCDAIGGEWVIELYPRGEAGAAVYNEGDITPSGAADITIKAMGEGRVVIAPTLAPAAGVIVSGFNLSLVGVYVTAPDATMPALRVTGGQCSLTDCFLTGNVAGDALQQVGGRIDAWDCNIVAGAIALSTAPCNLNFYHSVIYGGVNTAAEALAHTMWFDTCYFHNLDIQSLATGATTCTVTNSTYLDQITNAGTGDFYINGTSVSRINQTGAGTTTVYGGYVWQITRAVGSVIWWLNGYIIKVLPSDTITDTVIAHALAAATAAGRRVEIRLAPGDFEEDNLALADDCIIVGAGHTVASGSHVTINSANPVFTVGAVQANLRHLRITQAGAGAAFVINNAAAVVHLDSVEFESTAGNAITMTAGTCSIHSSTSNDGDYNLSAAACTLTMYRSCVTSGNIVTAGAFAHVVTLESICMSGGNITNGATGVGSITDIDIIKCFNIGTFTDASQLGTVLIEATIIAIATKTGTSPWAVRRADFALLSNENLTGAITCNGGWIYAITRAIGPIVWLENNYTYKVIPCGTITDTIIGWTVAAAGAGDTIVIHPGTYEEAVTLAAGINLAGIDKDNCIINGTAVTLITMAAGCRVSNLTLNATADGGNAIGIECNDQAFIIEGVDINLVRVDNNAYAISENVGATARIIILKNLRILSDTDTNEAGIFIQQAGKTFYVEGSFIQGGDYAVRCAVASTFYVSHSHLEVNVIPPGGGTTISCLAATMHFRGCTIEKQITVGDLGTVRLKNSSYREINRTGTGNIVDESPVLMDAPWKVHRWTWQAALANAQVAVRGTPLDAGSGQVLLEVDDSATESEAVEQLGEVAGSLANHFTPARTPRFLTQIAVDSFDAEVYMFFGLRNALSDYVPVATEDHAGFIWNGANFMASSDDGTAIQQTNLTAPTVNTHVQLEVIVFGGITTVGWVEFYINGVLVATHTTRIPVLGLDWQHLLEADSSGGGDEIDVTVRTGGVQECPA